MHNIETSLDLERNPLNTNIQFHSFCALSQGHAHNQLEPFFTGTEHDYTPVLSAKRNKLQTYWQDSTRTSICMFMIWCVLKIATTWGGFVCCINVEIHVFTNCM